MISNVFVKLKSTRTPTDFLTAFWWKTPLFNAKLLRSGWPDWHFRCQIREIWHFEVGVGNQITWASLPTFLASIWHSPEICKKIPKMSGNCVNSKEKIYFFFSYFLDVFALLIQVILHTKIKVARLLLCVSPDRLWEIFPGLRKFYHWNFHV